MKRFLALFLAVLMLATLIPTAAQAVQPNRLGGSIGYKYAVYEDAIDTLTAYRLGGSVGVTTADRLGGELGNNERFVVTDDGLLFRLGGSIGFYRTFPFLKRIR